MHILCYRKKFIYVCVYNFELCKIVCYLCADIKKVLYILSQKSQFCHHVTV